MQTAQRNLPPEQNDEVVNAGATKTVSRSSLVSKNITVNGHRTSVRLEPAMWASLQEIVRRERTTIHIVCSAIADNKPEDASLTAAIRVFIMSYFRAAATEEGHARSGHGQGPATDAILTLVQAVLDPSRAPYPLPSPYIIGKAYTPPITPPSFSGDPIPNRLQQRR